MQSKIKKIEKFFGKKYKIVFKDIKNGYSDDEKNVIVVSSKMNDKDKLLTIIHEFIHLVWKVEHNALSRKCGFNSWLRKRDYLSEFFYNIIFKKRSN